MKTRQTKQEMWAMKSKLTIFWWRPPKYIRKIHVQGKAQNISKSIGEAKTILTSGLIP